MLIRFAILSFLLVVAPIAGCGGWEDAPPPQEPTSLDVPAPGLTPELSPGDLEKRSDVSAPASHTEGSVLWIPANGSLRVPLGQLGSELNRSFTLELWLKPRALASRTIVTAGSNLRLILQGGALAAYVGGRWLRGSYLRKGQWQHVALVVDINVARLYLDGEFQDREYLPAEWTRPTAALIAGRAGPAAPGFEGFIDDLHLITRSLYNTPQFDPPVSLVPMDGNLLGYTFTTELPGELVPDEHGRGPEARMLSGARLVQGNI